MLLEMCCPLLLLLLLLLSSNNNAISEWTLKENIIQQYFMCDMMVLNFFLAISTNQFIQHVDHYNSIVLENLWGFEWF